MRDRMPASSRICFFFFFFSFLLPSTVNVSPQPRGEMGSRDTSNACNMELFSAIRLCARMCHSILFSFFLCFFFPARSRSEIAWQQLIKYVFEALCLSRNTRPNVYVMNTITRFVCGQQSTRLLIHDICRRSEIVAS